MLDWSDGMGLTSNWARSTTSHQRSESTEATQEVGSSSGNTILSSLVRVIFIVMGNSPVDVTP